MSGEELFFTLTRDALTSQRSEINLRDRNSWISAAEIIRKQNLESLLSSRLSQFDFSDDTIQPLLDQIIADGQKQVIRNYHLFYEARKVCRLFEEGGIRCAVIKGASIGAYYPEPESRKSGDVDIWIAGCDFDGNAKSMTFGPDFEKAERILIENGYNKSEEEQTYHSVFTGGNGFELEIHGRMNRDFENPDTRNILKSYESLATDRITSLHLMEGYDLPVLDEADTGIQILLHMLHHFTGSGFGWKLLCDWTAFWNAGHRQDTVEYIVRFISDMRLRVFVSVITDICIRYLGLKDSVSEYLITEKVSAPAEKRLITDMFEAGEFGDDDNSRMVMLSDRSVAALFRQFHLQMKQNYPSACRYVILWPALWLGTLLIFNRNNRRIRHMSGISIISNARKRSKLAVSLSLFKK